jgi:6-pyruvoyltetrahydropterin/6-carboxytetrahydropterin synthase
VTENDAARPLTRITTSATFSSAHRLHNASRDDEWNRAVFGKCNNPYGHGHTYGIEITVEGEIDPEKGWVLDFSDLKRLVNERIVKKCDCRNLNSDVDFLDGSIPTAEILAIRFWDQLAPHVAPARLVELVLHETERNRVVYRGGA